MTWVVTKYGGTSVSSPARWATIAGRAAELTSQGKRTWIVASALTGVTSLLERAR